MNAIRKISLIAYGQEISGLAFAIGETVEFDISCEDPDSRDPFDLTGGNVIFSISGLDLQGNPKQPPIVARQANIVNPATGGNITVPFASDDTANPGGLGPLLPDEYGFDLWITDAAGNRLQTLAFGAITFKPAATLPTTPIVPLPSQAPLAQGPAGPGNSLDFTLATGGDSARIQMSDLGGKDFLKLTPAELAAAKFLMGVSADPNPFGVRKNQVVTWGWNAARRDLTQAALYYSLEEYYHPFDGKEVMEWHWVGVAENGTTFRITSLEFNRLTADAQLALAPHLLFLQSPGQTKTYWTWNLDEIAGAGSCQISADVLQPFLYARNNSIFLYQAKSGGSYAPILMVNAQDEIEIAPGGDPIREHGTRIHGGAATTDGSGSGTYVGLITPGANKHVGAWAHASCHLDDNSSGSIQDLFIQYSTDGSGNLTLLAANYRPGYTGSGATSLNVVPRNANKDLAVELITSSFKPGHWKWRVEYEVAP